MLSRVLVPLDGTHEASAPLRGRTAGLIAQCGSQLELMTALPAPAADVAGYSLEGHNLAVPGPELAVAFEHYHRRMLEGFGGAGRVVEADDAAQAIIETLAGEDGISAVAMATHRTPTFLSQRLGQVAGEVFQKSSKPFLFAPVADQGERVDIGRVLVAVDLDEEDAQAPTGVVDSVLRGTGASAHVLLIDESDHRATVPDERASAALAAAEAGFKGAGVDAEMMFRRGPDIPRIIVETADSIEADLIITFSKARDRLQGWLMGASEAECVFQLTRLPVLALTHWGQ